MERKEQVQIITANSVYQGRIQDFGKGGGGPDNC